MKRWSVVCLPFLLCACGLLKVNINGKTHVLGESDPEEKTAEASSGSTSSGSSSSGSSSRSSGSSSSGDSSSSGSSSSSKKSADKEAKAQAEGLRRDTNATLREVDNLLISGPDAIPADKLAAVEAKGKALSSAGLADETSYVKHVLRYYRLENAWRGDASKTADTMAKELGGAVTAQGEVTGKDKPQTIKFKAEAGKCYTVFTHLKNAGGDDDRATGFFLDGGAKGSSFQRYGLSPRTTRGAGLRRMLSKSYTYGGCALEAMDVSMSVKLSYAGTQNGLRYVVVEHAREKLPTYIQVDLEPMLNDSCDVENWTNMWLQPLPGAVLYGGSAPFLAYDAGTAEEMWMTAWDPAKHEVRVQRKNVSSEAPKQFKFDPNAKFGKCPRKLENAHSPEGMKVAQCYAALDRKYDPLFNAAEKARDNATTLLSEINANKRLKALNNQYADEEDRTCGKIEDDVHKKMQAAYNKIVDFYMSTPPKNDFDRAAEMKKQHEGVFQIRCVGQHTCSM